jgi:hypothetical protein
MKSELHGFSKEQAKNFIAEYNKAVKYDARVFKFEGDDVLRQYAYYIIQWFVLEKFVDGKFDNKKKFVQYEQQR